MFSFLKWPWAIPTLPVRSLRTAVDWYMSIGFELLDRDGIESGSVWNSARLKLGSSELTLTAANAGDRPRESAADFSVRVTDVDELYEELKERVVVIRSPQNTLFGQREFVIQGIDNTRITFSQPIWGFRPLAG